MRRKGVVEGWKRGVMGVDAWPAVSLVIPDTNPAKAGTLCSTLPR